MSFRPLGDCIIYSLPFHPVCLTAIGLLEPRPRSAATSFPSSARVFRSSAYRLARNALLVLNVWTLLTVLGDIWAISHTEQAPALVGATIGHREGSRRLGFFGQLGGCDEQRNHDRRDLRSRSFARGEASRRQSLCDGNGAGRAVRPRPRAVAATSGRRRSRWRWQHSA